MLHRLPTRAFVVLPNSGHVTNERALAECVYWLMKIILTGVTLCALALHLKRTVLSQSELSDVFYVFF